MNTERDFHFFRVFISCVAQSLAIGLVCVAVFTLLVLTLSSPANAEGTEPEVRMNDVRQGSLLFKSDQPGVFTESPRLHTDVQMDITAMTARVKVKQSFHNQGPDWVEGIYVFPLPENAAVDHMRMRIGERIIEGQIKERQQAKKIYQQAKAAGKKAALVEQERPNMFTNSVANIGPGEMIEIEIEYQQSLSFRDGRFAIRYPMAITPRYIPGKQQLPAVEEQLLMNGSGWAMNTDQVPDASRITPPMAESSSSAPGPVTLSINLNAGIPLQHISSLYHATDITRGHNGKARIRLHQGQTLPDRDFVLEWQPTPSASPRAAVFSESGKDRQYSLIMVMPPVGDASQQSVLPREVVFVIDTSGSMGGTSIEQARMALMMAIKRLRPSDSFNVIEFNSSPFSLFTAPVAASPENVRHALGYVSNMEAGGGTEMYSALQRALSYPVRDDVLQQVVFLTDGAVGNEDELFQLIKDQLDRVRLFTVGIGSAPNSHFMTRVAQFGRGSFTYVGDLTEVQQKMQELFSKLETPAMSDLRLEWPTKVGQVVSYPERLPDLYHGEPLIITAATDVLDGELMINGLRGQRPWKAALPLNQHQKQPGVSVLWARNRIAALMDSRHDGIAEAEIRQHVIDTALEHHLVSKYTSLVAVDVTPTRPVDKSLNSKNISGAKPKGLVMAPMAKTATNSQLHQLFGLLILLTVFITGISWRRSSRPNGAVSA